MLFTFNFPYLVYNKNGTTTIAEDCPKDKFERYQETDKDFFEKTGTHLFTNFETEK